MILHIIWREEFYLLSATELVNQGVCLKDHLEKNVSKSKPFLIETTQNGLAQTKNRW